MSHKAKIFALVIGTLISSQAIAMNNSVYFLAGGGYGLVNDGKLDSMVVSGSNATLTAKDEWAGTYHGGMGVRIDGPWGMETNYWQYASIKESASTATKKVNQNAVSRSVDLTFVGRACLVDALTGYARLGLGYAWLNRDNSLNTLLTTDGDSQNEQSLGVAGALGLEYDFNDWFFARAEVATITGSAMQSNGTLNLGVRFS